ncbi:MAG: Photosynthesis system assembly factor [Chloroflexota bacterium]|nr:Photosynthesis system assembly factor [Chloroflexota bacterium]
MTTLAALLLIAVVLSIMAQPLLIGRVPTRARSEPDDAREWDERYRAALADLQDAELDRELGNLSEGDYAAVRDHHRRRAALALQELDTRDAQRARVRAEIEREAARLVGALHPGSAAEAPTGGPPAQPWVDSRPVARSTTARPAAASRALPRLPLAIGGAVALLVLVGITAIYLRAQSTQAAQAPLAALPADQANMVMIDQAGTYWLAHQTGLIRSANGRSWQPVSIDGDVRAIVDMPDRARRLAFGPNVLLQSGDGGASWTPGQSDLPRGDVRGAGLGAEGLYAYVANVGVLLSRDGSHWEQTGSALPQDVGALAVLPEGDADVLFAAVGGSVRRSADGGRTWSAAAGAAGLALVGSTRTVFADPSRDAVYAATTDGLFRSASKGADWVKLPFRGSLTAGGARGDRIAVVDEAHNFYLSTDNGGSWLAN